LRVEKPGPGFCHFPSLPSGQPIRGYDEEYFKGLKAEHRVIRHKLGFRTYVWEKLPSQRNEPFDCRILNLAVISMPSSGINLDTMQRDVVTEEQDRRQERPPLFGAQNTMASTNIDGLQKSVLSSDIMGSASSEFMLEVWVMLSAFAETVEQPAVSAVKPSI
jgi:phage terminase large subunit GpA-like protein